MHNSVSMLKKISILLLFRVKEDTLTSFLEISFLRLKTEEQARDGTSTEIQEPSNLEKRISLLISNHPVRAMLSNTTQPTQDGGKSGDTTVLKTQTELARMYPELVKLST